MVRGSVMGDQLVGYVVPAVGSVVDVSVLRGGFVGGAGSGLYGSGCCGGVGCVPT
ncbi:hypothetical protein AB9M10_23210 [Rhodococcus erythropolis]